MQNTNQTGNKPISWQTWRDLLSNDELDAIALEVQLEPITLESIKRFDALCDFRRSMKLFNQYAQ